MLLFSSILLLKHLLLLTVFCPVYLQKGLQFLHYIQQTKNFVTQRVVFGR